MYCCDKPIIHPNKSGITQLQVGWDIPDLSADSLWNLPVARNLSVVSTVKRDWHGVVSAGAPH